MTDLARIDGRISSNFLYQVDFRFKNTTSAFSKKKNLKPRKKWRRLKAPNFFAEFSPQRNTLLDYDKAPITTSFISQGRVVKENPQLQTTAYPFRKQKKSK